MAFLSFAVISPYPMTVHRTGEVLLAVLPEREVVGLDAGRERQGELPGLQHVS
jgi:hypothetical protein